MSDNESRKKFPIDVIAALILVFASKDFQTRDKYWNRPLLNHVESDGDFEECHCDKIDQIEAGVVQHFTLQWAEVLPNHTHIHKLRIKVCLQHCYNYISQPLGK